MKKLFLVILTIFLLFISISARAKYQGIAGKGGKLVKTSTVTSYKLEETYPLCTIDVYLTGTTTHANIYSDNTETVKANPFFAGSDASYFFYADNGRYDIKFSGTGIVTPFTLSDILISDITNSGGSAGVGVYKLSSYAGDLQAAVDDVMQVSGFPENLGSGGEIQIDRAVVDMTRPLVINKNFISLGGLTTRRTSTIRNNNAFYGPLVYVAPPDYPSINTFLSTSLVTGSGNSYIMSGNDNGARYLNLSDSDSMDLNGLSQLTVECFLRPTLDTTADIFARDILGSTGKISSNSPISRAFYIYQFTNNSVVAIITTSAGTVTLTTADNQLLLNQVNHIALTYNGTTVRLYIGGVLKASSALTGTIKQLPYEQVVLGGVTGDWPSRLNTGATSEGKIDSIRISNMARYVTAFTAPTTKFTADANNLLLLNFNSFYRGMVVGTAGLATSAYIPFRVCGICAGALLTNVKLHDIQFATSSGGLYVTSTVLTEFDNLDFENPKISMWLYDNAFLSMMKNIKIIARSGSPNGGIAGLIITQQSGVVQIDGLDAGGGAFQVIVATSSGIYNRMFLSPNSYTIGSGVFKSGGAINANYVFNGLITDYETNAITVPQFSFLFDNVAVASINGALMEMNPDGGLIVPNILIDGGNSYNFVGVQSFNSNLGDFVKFLAAPIGTVTLINPYKYVPTQPYTTGTDIKYLRIFDMNGMLTLSAIIPFTSLGTPPNSTITYCTDCTNASNPCSSGGTGAIAKRINNAWDCR